jgi:hypothetical protein
MFTSLAFEVSLGLIFTFLIFSTACSGVNEGIQRVLNSRGKALFDAINGLIGDVTLAKDFWQHDLVTGLMSTSSGTVKSTKGDTDAYQNAVNQLGQNVGSKVDPNQSLTMKERRTLPSYIAPSTFATVVLDILGGSNGGPDSAPADGGTPTAQDAAAGSAPGASGGNPSSSASSAKGTLVARLQALGLPPSVAKAGADLEQVEANVEKWFNDSMDRLSGWYKRYVIYFLLGLAAAVTIGFNVNTIHIATELWSQPQLQAAVTAEAQSATSHTAADTSRASTTDQLQSTSPTDLPSVKTALNNAETLPVGWGAVNQPGSVGWGNTILGWLITIVAISFGAPFWFDLLTRMNSLSLSGPPPSRSK